MKLTIKIDNASLRNAVETQVGIAVAAFAEQAIKGLK